MKCFLASFISLLSITALAQVRYTGSNFGIGTSSPSSALNVHGSTQNIEISNTSETEAGILFYDHGYESAQNAKIMFNCSSGRDLNFYSDNTEVFSIRAYNGSSSYFELFDSKIIFNSFSGYERLYPMTSSTLFEIGFGSSLPANRVYTRFIYRNTEYALSDQKVKERVTNVNNAMSLIKSLRPVTYDLNKRAYWRSDETREIPSDNSFKMKNQFGFIAQEVREVLPQLVDEDTSSNLLYMNYEALIPILVKALQEQQKEIDELKKEIDKDNSSNKRVSSSHQALEQIKQINQNKLIQNAPNPFGGSTQIAYSTLSNSIDRKIIIFNMNGALIKTIQIQETGAGKITIAKGELSPGIYLYSLVVDGEEIDTKRMILEN